MFDPDEVQQVITESDARYAAITLQFAEGMGVPEAWRPLMVAAQSDLMVLTFLCTYLMNRPSRQPTVSVAGEKEWRWGYATLDGEEPVVRGLARLVRGKMAVEIKHGDKVVCDVEPFGPGKYLVFPGEDKPQQEMSRLDFILWAFGLIQFAIMEADLGVDVSEVLAEHAGD